MQIPQDQIILVPSQTICQILKRRPHFSGNHEKLEVKKKPATMRKKYMRWKNTCLRQKKLWGKKNTCLQRKKTAAGTQTTYQWGLSKRHGTKRGDRDRSLGTKVCSEGGITKQKQKRILVYMSGTAEIDVQMHMSPIRWWLVLEEGMFKGFVLSTSLADSGWGFRVHTGLSP